MEPIFRGETGLGGLALKMMSEDSPVSTSRCTEK
jgi:hypothetical protein